MFFSKFYFLLCLVSVFGSVIVHASDLERTTPMELASPGTGTHGGADFQNIIQIPQEHWYSLSLMGTKIGYTHTSLEKSEYQGEPILRIQMERVMNLSGLGKDLTLEISWTEYTGTDLMPHHFLSTSNAPGSKQVGGQIVKGMVSLTTTLDSKTTHSKVRVPPDTISTLMGVNLLLAQKLIRVGEKQVFHTFS